jgi:hypothetical protein
MHTKTKQLVAAAAFAGALVTGTAGTAAAAGAPNSNRQSTASTAQLPRRLIALRRMRRVALRTVLTLTHTNRAELVAALKNGQSIAQFAAAHGSSGQAVTAALVPKLEAALAKAVTRGHLTQARADTLKTKLPALVTNLVNRNWTQAAA